MGDNSNLVLRWEIDNATATFAAGIAESEIFNEGGFKWKMGLHESSEDRTLTVVTVTCDHEERREWRCDADVQFVVHRLNAPRSFPVVQNAFDNASRVIQLAKITTTLITLPAQGYIRDDKIVFECHIVIINSKIIDLTKFCPNGMGNMTLVIGDKKVRVSKEFLSVLSPVFAAMFFGNFAESEKEEVEIKDVAYEEFIDLLQLIYSRIVKITDHTVPHILKLADRFQVEDLVKESEEHLKHSRGFDEMKKLLFADQFRLESLKHHCLDSFTSLTSLHSKIKTSPDYANLSAEMKSSICDRMAKLA